jgi:hypothetical protein
MAETAITSQARRVQRVTIATMAVLSISLNNLDFFDLPGSGTWGPDRLNQRAAQGVEDERGAGALAQVPRRVDRTDLLAMQQAMY